MQIKGPAEVWWHKLNASTTQQSQGHIQKHIVVLCRFPACFSTQRQVSQWEAACWMSSSADEEKTQPQVWCFANCSHLMVPFTKLAYLSNLTLHNNHFLAEIRTLRSKSPANTRIKMIFHHRLIHRALSCTLAVRFPRSSINNINRGVS